MLRLFSIKYCLKSLSCILLLLLVTSNLLFTIIPIDQSIRKYITRNRDIFYPLSPFHRREEQSLLRYFQQKKQNIKQSPFKIILHNTLKRSFNKKSFLIYEYTRHRQFCKKQANASIYIPICPFQNCYFTCNSSFINRADAILMLYSKLDYKQLSNFNRRRNSNQIWMLWHDEPYPPSSIYNTFLFNWTISYRFDSEVSVATYGITLTRNQPMDQSEFDKWINKNYNKRRNEAVWFVSNCKRMKRLEYYEKLKEYFPISAFGKCITNLTKFSQNCTHRSQCEVEKFATSKFYLSFESIAVRPDYITEKFWRSLSLGLIPIVLGPKRRDYERVAPPNSFIYAEDYQNPKALAKHLHDIATNQNEYEKYHQWRINYETHYQGVVVEAFRFCELCYRLNTNRDHIWYTDINKYFLDTN